VIGINSITCLGDILIYFPGTYNIPQGLVHYSYLPLRECIGVCVFLSSSDSFPFVGNLELHACVRVVSRVYISAHACMFVGAHLTLGYRPIPTSFLMCDKVYVHACVCVHATIG
jgi:hypothetical protein